MADVRGVRYWNSYIAGSGEYEYTYVYVAKIYGVHGKEVGVREQGPRTIARGGGGAGVQERPASKYYERRFGRSGKYYRVAGLRGELLPSTPRTVGTWFCKCFANGILS